MIRRLLFAAAIGALTSCGPRTTPAREPGAPDPMAYDHAEAWLCFPGRAGDACQRDLGATELRPDGTRVVVPSPSAAVDSKVDCFYVYPTVDLDLVPRNHTAFRGDERISDVARFQAARFREACAVYAPFYRQVTIGTYLRPDPELEHGLSIAYADVSAAFAYYLEHANRGRKIVLVGHSQGAEMVIRLLRQFFDDSPERRKQLLLAMPIGGTVETAAGARTGGTFTTLPTCAADDEVGCIVAYRSHLASRPVVPGRYAPKPGHRTVCVNPAGIEGDTNRPFSRAYLPVNDRTRGHLRDAGNVTTPFLLLRDFYSGRCVDGPDGYRYLAVTPNGANDPRVDPIDFERAFPQNKPLAVLGLHILDLQLAQGDLVDMVARRAAAVP